MSVITPYLEKPCNERSNPPETGTTFQPYEVITELQVLDPLRLHSLRTVEPTFTSFNQQSCIYNHSEVITILSFSQVPMSPYLILRSWELQGGDQSPLLPVGVGPDWRLALGPYLILWPLLVGWSIPPKSLVRIQPCRELEHQCEREPGIPSGGTPPHSSRDSFAPAWPSHLSGGSRGWCGWNLAGASRNVAETSNRESKHHTQRVGELRFIIPVGPEELTLQALSPEQRDYRVFTDRL